MPHAFTLNAEQAAIKGRQLVDFIEMDIRDRRALLRKQIAIRNTYFGAPSYTPIRPNGSNIELRVVTEKIESTVPKLVNAFWYADPTVNVRRWSAQESAPDVTDSNEAYINYLMNSGIPDLYAIMETWFRNSLIDGVSVLKTSYNYSTRQSVIVEPCKMWWRPGDVDLTGQAVPQERLKTPAEILLQLFGQWGSVASSARGLLNIDGPLDPTEPIETFNGESWDIDFIESRRPYYDVSVEFWPGQYIDETDVYIYRPVVVEDGVDVKVIEFEDLIVPYRTTSLQKAPRVAEQYWLTIPELEKLIETDGWDITPDELIALKAQAASERQEEHTENDELRRQKDDVTGMTGDNPIPVYEGAEGVPAFADNQILMFEVYATDDVAGPLSSCEMIYHIPYCLRKVVRSKYLEEEYPHGRRPFADLHYLRLSNRYYSVSMAEILAPIQVEVNAIINMINEAQEIISNPWFGYIPSALTTDPEVLKNILPGTGIPLGDPNGLIFPRFTQEPLANLSALDSLLLFADRLTVSPQASGSSQVRNAPRTARGTLALLSEAGIKTDLYITAAQRGGWRELVHQIHGLESWFGDEEKYFLVTGNARPQRITQKEMRGRFEYTFSGNSVNTNREVMRTISQTRFNTLAGEPLYQMDLQARQKLVRDFLRHFSEGVNVDELTPRLPGQGGTRLPLDPNSAIRVIMAGVPLTALPQEDHAAYVETFSKFALTREFEMMPEWQVAIFGSLLLQHQQLLAQQQQQGGPVGGPGQGNNVPSGDLSTLEGGVV